MFSGIIEQVGVIVSVSPRGAGRTLEIRSDLPVAPAGDAGVGRPDRERVGLGDSIAVFGACLTVEAVSPPDRFTVACGRETIEQTRLGDLKVGDSVHLERALRVGDRLDGHLVSGHVDGVGTLRAISRDQESVVMHVDVPSELSRYVAVKGSLCIDGVSLTVNAVDDCSVRVNIVPFTADHTLLGRYRGGARVNLEVDLIARYLERLVGDVPTAGLTRDRLFELGFGSGRRR